MADFEAPRVTARAVRAARAPHVARGGGAAARLGRDAAGEPARLARWAVLGLALLLVSHTVVWETARRYERGQLALLYQAVAQGADVMEASHALWAAVDRDVRLCHDRLMALTKARPPRKGGG